MKRWHERNIEDLSSLNSLLAGTRMVLFCPRKKIVWKYIVPGTEQYHPAGAVNGKRSVCHDPITVTCSPLWRESQMDAFKTKRQVYDCDLG